jgi:hypothetical protein
VHLFCIAVLVVIAIAAVLEAAGAEVTGDVVGALGGGMLIGGLWMLIACDTESRRP